MILDVSPEMLESLGYRVYTAGSGQEALFRSVFIDSDEGRRQRLMVE